MKRRSFALSHEAHSKLADITELKKHKNVSDALRYCIDCMASATANRDRVSGTSGNLLKESRPCRIQQRKQVRSVGESCTGLDI